MSVNNLLVFTKIGSKSVQFHGFTAALYVDGREVQLVAFVGKRLLYRRLGHSVELDLQEIPDDQRFTLSIEWSY